jgi:membrane fusion protein, heavy metal efflux system
MFADFSIITEEEETAPAVPRSALVYEGATARVWMAGDDGTIAARPVRPGRTADGMVPQGVKVVTSPAPVIDRAIGNG